MFKNSGKKIMGFVKFVFYFNMVVAALLVVGLTVYVGIEFDAGKAVIALLAGCAVAALYLFLIFLAMLSMYAFGELVQSSIDQNKLLESGNAEQKKLLEQILEAVKAAPVQAQETAAAPVQEPVVPKPVVNTCPECGTVLDEGVNFCRNCGARVNR